MKKPMAHKALYFTLVAVIATALTGCKTLTRLSELGAGPELTEIVNPTAKPDYRPVSMPMPAPEMAEENRNSLWRAGAKAFFKDNRAKAIGDVLTVTVSLDDSATLKNKTTRKRADTEDVDVTTFAGLESEFRKVLPQGIAAGGTIGSFGSAYDTEGDGNITRSEAITLSVAAVVTQILPNGNLVVIGRQEMRISDELREVMVTGVVRPEDIAYDNTVSHTKIAEMRVAYGGRGMLSDLQSPRWGNQLWDVLFPF